MEQTFNLLQNFVNQGEILKKKEIGIPENLEQKCYSKDCYILVNPQQKYDNHDPNFI